MGAAENMRLDGLTAMNAAGSPEYFVATIFFMGATVAVGLTTLWVVIRRRRIHEAAGDPNAGKPVIVARNTPPKHNKKYYAVSVQPGISACQAIEKIRGDRYLTLEAPKLPLSDCSNTDCRCILKPENDRRVGFDRRDGSFSAYGDFNPSRFSRGRNQRAERRKR